MALDEPLIVYEYKQSASTEHTPQLRGNASKLRARVTTSVTVILARHIETEWPLPPTADKRDVVERRKLL
jgi:hypothetical protein